MGQTDGPADGRTPGRFIDPLRTLCGQALYTHTHPFNGPSSGTSRVSRYQKGKTNLDFTEARDGQ